VIGAKRENSERDNGRCNLSADVHCLLEERRHNVSSDGGGRVRESLR